MVFPHGECGRVFTNARSMYKKSYDAMYEEFSAQLVELSRSDEDRVKWLQQAVALCYEYMKRLKRYFLRNEPKSPEDEMCFFKTVKPRFKAQLLFHQSVLDIEGRRPPGGEALTAHYLREMERLTYYFNSNLSFYDYVRRDSCHLDQHYYLRGMFDVGLCPHENLVDFDECFNTSHDSKLAQLLANEMTLSYLERRIERINNKESGSFLDMLGEEIYTWTETQAAFVEHCYGLILSKAVNHGKLVTAAFIHYMEKVFHTTVKNFYGTYNDLSERTNQTLFTDKVRQALIDKMNE